MLLAIDVGNTNSKFAVFDGDRIVAQFRLRTEAKRMFTFQGQNSDTFTCTVLYNPQTPNPKPQTSNPKPQTPNPKP